MASPKNTLDFAFSRRNYMLLLAGVVIIILGFSLMSGGGSDDPAVFKGDYTLDDQAFSELEEGQMAVDASVREKLSPLRNKVFGSEDAMLLAVNDAVGPADNLTLWKIRGAANIDAEIFSGRRITLAPIVVLFGYGFIFFAIMYREKKQSQPVSDMAAAE